MKRGDLITIVARDKTAALYIAHGYINPYIQPQYPGHLSAYYETATDDGWCVQHSVELIEHDQGVVWIYGHHATNSAEAKSLLVAYTLNGADGAARTAWTRAFK